jgi:hypothetical protein
MRTICLQSLLIAVTVWEMETLNAAIVGSGENTPLSGSIPLAGTNFEGLFEGRMGFSKNMRAV